MSGDELAAFCRVFNEGIHAAVARLGLDCGFGADTIPVGSSGPLVEGVAPTQAITTDEFFERLARFRIAEHHKAVLEGRKADVGL